MLNVGINGLGRIGRAIFRNNLDKKVFRVVAVNDINPDIGNITYQLNYDTLYDALKDQLLCDDEYIYNQHERIRVTHEAHIDEVDWKASDVDIVIDASGVLDNVLRAKETIRTHALQSLFVTHSPEEVDFTMVLGANEAGFDVHTHKVIASSICDATALGPVLRLIEEQIGIRSGYVTTLHPWLNYQKLHDGPSSSWSVPGEIYHHYALGRSAIGNMIPKPTSAIAATCKVVEGIDESMVGSFSYRTPTAIVGSADITLNLRDKVAKERIIDIFEKYEQEQQWDIIHNNIEPLVSLDFKRSSFSAIVDHRWTEVLQGDLLKLVLWYDNEWGYASRVVDQVDYVARQMEV